MIRIIHECDHSTMNGREKWVHGALFYAGRMAGLFAGLFTLALVSNAVGLTAHGLADEWPGFLVSATGATAVFTLFHFRPPASWTRKHDLTAIGLDADRTGRDR